METGKVSSSMEERIFILHFYQKKKNPPKPSSKNAILGLCVEPRWLLCIDLC